MIFIFIIRWFCGYVCFRAKGGFYERFLNLCAANGITVWGVKYKNGTLHAKMSRKDYKNVLPIARRAKTRLKIVSKRGLYSRAAKYRGRYGLAVGFLAFILILRLLSSVIWNININGNKTVRDEKILAQLNEIGIYEGVFASSIDAENARQQLLISCPELSWCAINIDGCIANVDVKETAEKKLEAKTDYPANIIAKRGGTIMSIRAYYGAPSVSVGEAVAKGDILVSGTMENKYGGIMYCEARAEVIAQTVHKLSVTVPFNQQRKVDIAKPQTRKILTLFGAQIPLFFGKVDEPYTVKRTHTVPEINGKRLPFAMDTATFTRQKIENYTIDSAKAEKIAKAQMENKSKKELGSILKKQLNEIITKSNDGITLTAEFLCEENIADSKKISIK